MYKAIVSFLFYLIMTTEYEGKTKFFLNFFLYALLKFGVWDQVLLAIVYEVYNT